MTGPDPDEWDDGLLQPAEPPSLWWVPVIIVVCLAVGFGLLHLL